MKDLGASQRSGMSGHPPELLGRASSTLLVLAEDEDTRTLITGALGTQNVRVLECDAPSLLEPILEREQIDLIIAVSNGSQAPTLASLVRALDLHPQLRTIVFVEADAYEPERPVLERETRAMLLLLPLEVSTLQHQVRVLMHRDEQHADADPGASVDDRLKELQLEYAEALPARLDAVVHALDAIRVRGEPPDGLRTLVHRLRGNAAAYGFPAISQAAGQIEDLLVSRESTGLTRGDFAQIELGVSDMASSAQMVPELLSGAKEGTGLLGLKPLLLVTADRSLFPKLQTAARDAFLETVLARSARDALSMAQRRTPAVVVIDAALEQDYAGLSTKLRHVCRNEDLKVIFLADASGRADVVSASALRGCLVVPRTATETELGDALRDLSLDQQTERQRVLVVDDDRVHTVQLEAVLESMGVVVRKLESAERLSSELEAFDPDLLLLDLYLPGENGIEICRSLRRSVRHQHLPIVLMTARSDLATRVEAYRAGASDFAVKPLLPEELCARVGVRLEQAKLLRNYQERDPLTGLLRRRPFVEAAHRAIARALRAGDPLSIALFDIDDMDAISERYGLLAGESLVSHLGRLIRGRFRACDVRCRWGGDEFVVLFEGTEPMALEPTLARLLREFGEAAFVGEGGKVFRGRFSVGVSALPQDGETLHTLLLRASQRMREVKNTGGNRVAVADEVTSTNGEEA